MKKPTRKDVLLGRPQLTFAEQRGVTASRSKEFTLQNLFNYGYRNKEDVSNLPANTLVVGSQNVLTNASEVVGIRNGYVLDGSAGNQNTYGIDSAYDFINANGIFFNLRKWGSNLEVRYVNPVTSAVSWVNILSTLNAANPVNFTSFWDAVTEFKELCLFVNGDSKLYIWSGGLGSFASSTASQAGIVTGVSLNAAGTGYLPGDTLTITGGGGNATAQVLSTGVSGAVTSIRLTNPGNGYVTNTAIPTTSTGGTGATVDITAVGAGGSITLSGSYTTAQLGFFDAAADSSKFKLNINGTTYTYTSVSGNTFYGVTPDPSLASIAVGDPVFQLPFSNSANTGDFTGMPTTFIFNTIATLENQVWYGSNYSNTIYVSKQNVYLNVQFSNPRLQYEGSEIILDAPPTGFSTQAGNMYISAGRNQWWISQKDQQTVTVLNAAILIETLYAVRLKTAFNQGAQSQGLIGNYKNSIIYVSNEQIINALGLVQNIQSDPQVTNLSDPIKFDVDAYDFTGGQVIYDNYYIYVSVPVYGVVRMYNVQKQYWEAPQTIPVSRFYHLNTIMGNSIYGHSSLTNESYQLFTGYNDNGNPINSVAAFPYVASQGGAPFEKKSFNKIYTEGYIASNTNLMLTINYNFGGYSGTYTTIIPGSPSGIIFNKITDGSLGQNSLGSQPIGTILNIPNAPAIPKFRIVNTMPRVNFYDYQIVYSSDDVDFNWTLLRLGPAISPAADLPFEITI